MSPPHVRNRTTPAACQEAVREGITTSINPTFNCLLLERRASAAFELRSSPGNAVHRSRGSNERSTMVAVRPAIRRTSGTSVLARSTCGRSGHDILRLGRRLGELIGQVPMRGPLGTEDSLL